LAIYAATHISRANCNEIAKDRPEQLTLRMRFLALNVDFNGPSHDPFCSRTPAHESFKEKYSSKMCAFDLSNDS